MFGFLTTMKVVKLALGRNRKPSVKLGGGDTDEYSQGNPEDVNNALISRDSI